MKPARFTQTCGAPTSVFARRAGLTGKARWQRFAAAYETLRNDKGLLPLDYCISYIVIAKP